MIKFLSSTSYKLYLVSFFTTTLGLTCQVLIARNYGASSALDAYFISIAIPVFLASLIASACSFGLIPRLTEYQYSPSEFVYFSQAMYIIGAIICIFFLLMLLLAPIQVSYYSEFLSIDRKTLLVLFRIGWCIGACQIFVSIGSAILNAKGLYIVSTSLGWFPYLGIIISIMVLNEGQNILNLSFGLLLGTLNSLVLSVLLLYKILISNYAGFLPQIYRYISEIVIASSKSIVIASIFTSYLVVDSFWAPMLGDGAMSVLGYAQRIIGSIGAIVIAAIFVIIGREAQIELSLNGIDGFRKLSIKFIKTTLLLSVILAIFLFIFIEDIIYLLFTSEYFNDQDLSVLASTVRIMLPGMICMLVSTILTKLILCLNNSIYKALGIGLVWPALYFMGIYVFFDLDVLAAAASYSIAWLFVSILLLTHLFKQTKNQI